MWKSPRSLLLAHSPLAVRATGVRAGLAAPATAEPRDRKAASMAGGADDQSATVSDDSRRSRKATAHALEVVGGDGAAVVGAGAVVVGQGVMASIDGVQAPTAACNEMGVAAGGMGAVVW